MNPIVNHKKLKDSLVLLDQAAGQKQITILEILRKKYRCRTIIAGTLNERKIHLSGDVVWEKAMPYNRSNIVVRLLSWIVFSIQSYFIINKKYKNSHLFIITNPPLTIFLTFFLKNTFDVLVFDLYPDALAEYKYISKNSIIYKIWVKFNVKLFRKASRVFTLSEGMAHQLSTYVNREKIEIVELWTDNTFLKPIPKKDNQFVYNLGLENKFTVMYSGNMGMTHPVELLVDLAFELKDVSEIYFLLIGGGHKFKILEDRIKSSGLNNIKILPWQPSEQLPYSINAADLGVVTLDDQASKLSVPSKIFDLFSIGVPVLGIGSSESELSRLLNFYKSGNCYSSTDLVSMKNFVLELVRDQNFYKSMAENSLKASLNHTPINAKGFL